jgi:hypothetical protein
MSIMLVVRGRTLLPEVDDKAGDITPGDAPAGSAGEWFELLENPNDEREMVSKGLSGWWSFEDDSFEEDMRETSVTGLRLLRGKCRPIMNAPGLAISSSNTGSANGST